MTIKVQDVIEGDLLFPYPGPADDTPPGNKLKGAGTAGHVGIVTTTIEGHGAALFTHQVDGANLKGTWETAIKVPEDSDGVTSRIRVVRCKNPALRQEAARLAKAWDNYLVPFGGDRRNYATMFENKYEDKKAYVALQRQLFELMGKFRAIKYAARRVGPLCYKEESGGHGKGLFCSQFVTICYQVAGISEAVEAADPQDLLLHVTDKKPDFFKALDAFVTSPNEVDFRQYANYCYKLNDKDPYKVGAKATPSQKKRSGVEYVPSITYWKYSPNGAINAFPWQQKITRGMMVDSKVIMPQGLFDCLMDDPDGWEDCGYLTGTSVAPEHYKPLLKDPSQKIKIQKSK